MERNTQQRRAILRVFKKTGRPLSVQEVLSLAQKRCPGLGIATVYRNLKALMTDDQIISVDMPGGTIVYELVGNEHHHHFSCVRCEKTFDIMACETDFKKLLPAGFQLQAHEILLSGYCDSCSK